MRVPYERVGRTSLSDDVTDEVLLAVVCSKDADLVGRVTDHAHVHEYSHHVPETEQGRINEQEER